MIRTRVIPCLLLQGDGLVKTTKFSKPRYIGDPINAVRIFNEKECHELVFLDILASRENRAPQYDVISNIASECFMPLAYGGGVRCLADVRQILSLGVEKVVINTYAIENPDFIRQVAQECGRQSVVVSIDAKKNFWGKYEVFSRCGQKNTGKKPEQWAREAAALGAGEIIINSIDQDGIMSGYDIELIRSVATAVDIPVVALGGAGKLEDFGLAIGQGMASAVSAGSFFVFYGRHKAVLINFPSDDDLKKVLE